MMPWRIRGFSFSIYGVQRLMKVFVCLQAGILSFFTSTFDIRPYFSCRCQLSSAIFAIGFARKSLRRSAIWPISNSSCFSGYRKRWSMTGCLGSVWKTVVIHVAGSADGVWKRAMHGDGWQFVMRLSVSWYYESASEEDQHTKIRAGSFLLQMIKHSNTSLYQTLAESP